LRFGIHIFKEENGRYPKSLVELRGFLENADKNYWFEMYIDLTSKKTNKVKEYRKLNDEGGYYYDPNTGEVRFNMTRPIKEYLPHYRGKRKDQVPSTW
jgi:hypothetical protein